jgi:hypothetical protein
MGKTLVCIVNSLRSFALSVPSLVENVLKPLNADVLYVGAPSTDNRDTLDLLPRVPTLHEVLVPETTDWTKELNVREPEWSQLLAFKGPWLGGVVHKGVRLEGSGALQWVIREKLLQNLMACAYVAKYDRFIVTRSDFVYLAPLTEERFAAPGIHIPDGERHGGYTDRFACADRDSICQLLALTRTMRDHPVEFAHNLVVKYGMEHLCFHLNPEQMLAMWLAGEKVTLFPYTMYTTKRTEDPTSWSKGVFIPKLGYCVKYPLEYELACHNAGKEL